MFRFPPNKRAKEATLHEKMKKINEEFNEATRAYMDHVEFGDEPLAGELWDVIYATEGALRKLDKNTVEEECEATRAKAKACGDIA